MGYGASLAFIAVGAILAFATRFEISGIDLQMIGWILIAVGAVGAFITMSYTRPRRRRQLVEAEDEPVYIERDEVPPHVHTRPEGDAGPHLHTHRDSPGPGFPP
jgi:hypothetical protein